jgi:hypothetical protein
LLSGRINLYRFGGGELSFKATDSLGEPLTSIALGRNNQFLCSLSLCEFFDLFLGLKQLILCAHALILLAPVSLLQSIELFSLSTDGLSLFMSFSFKCNALSLNFGLIVLDNVEFMLFEYLIM